MPRSPTQAKGLLLSSILHSKDPVIFMEPKILYRAAVEEVPNKMYTLPLGKAEVLKSGSDLTIISYGRPLYNCLAAIEAAERDFKGISIELIDLRTIYPWDRQTILDSVAKTGRAMIVHESMVNYGVGAEIAATIQEKAFFHLKSPVQRLGGWTTHTGLLWEKFIFPDVASMALPSLPKLLRRQIAHVLTSRQEYTTTFTNRSITKIGILNCCECRRLECLSSQQLPGIGHRFWLGDIEPNCSLNESISYHSAATPPSYSCTSYSSGYFNINRLSSRFCASCSSESCA